MDHEKYQFFCDNETLSCHFNYDITRVTATTFLPTTYDVPDTDLSEYICSFSLFSQNLWDKILILYLSTEIQSVTKGNLFMPS